jgi:hypothetical protein
VEDLTKVKWRKARASGSNGGECVEVAGLERRRFAVRDSKDPNGSAFIFTARAWRAFVDEIKAGTLG